MRIKEAVSLYQQQSYQSQPSFVQSQYRGDMSSQARFQPTGYVQSYYQGMSPIAAGSYSGSTYPASTFQNQGYNQAQSGFGQSQFTGTESFHAANYRGNQPGHDNYLRADSINPSGSFASGYGQAGIGATRFQGTEAYHTANYRGNQLGHDQYLRADSTNPSTSGISGGMGSAYSTGYGAVPSQYQAQNPQSYHTAGYVGNQAGHDNYLRADSTQPSQFSQYSFR